VLEPHFIHHPRSKELLRELFNERGFDLDETYFDVPRLRTAAPGGYLSTGIAYAFHPHRDTWYGHPSALITAWIPICDLASEETFVFFPEKFRSPVANDSEIFDYQEWVAKGWGLKIGWQQKNAGLEARYPGVVGDVETGAAVGFACRRGDILLFSGAQFHRTFPQQLGRTRFSLDFRFVDLADHTQGLGAPNVDNRSRGSALCDYVRGDATT